MGSLKGISTRPLLDWPLHPTMQIKAQPLDRSEKLPYLCEVEDVGVRHFRQSTDGTPEGVDLLVWVTY